MKVQATRSRNRELRRAGHAFLALAVLTASGGCFVNKPYPPEWSPLVSTKGMSCPDISGDFKDRDVSDKISLSDVLLRRSSDKRSSNSPNAHVAISQTSTSVNVTTYIGDAPSESKMYLFDKDFQCDDGRIVFKTGRSLEENAVGYEWGSNAFQKSEDGSLILHEKSSTIGMLLLIPAVVGGSDYYCFEQYSR